ncbi:MAG TPA: surface lipoprotein assembly modifier [Methylophilus sp.]
MPWANNKRIRRIFGLPLQQASLVFLLTFIQPLAQAAELEAKQVAIHQAETLIKQGQFEAAYQQLQPLEATLAGDVKFDLLLGTAALESGYYSQAMFALERVLAVEPDNTVARAKVAQAHFQLNEMAASKLEFNHLLSQDPSAETTKAIERYMSAIDKAMGLSTNYTAFLEGGSGWDSNVNSATNANSIAIPVFGGLNFSLLDDARKKSTSFLNVAGGAGVRLPVNAQVSLIANLGFSKKLYQDYQQFETGTLDANVGIQLKQDNNRYTLALQDGYFYVDDATFRHAYGASAQWQHDFDAFNQASVYGQYAKLEYADNAIRNAHRNILGANYAHAFQSDLNPIVYVGAYLGREDTTKSGMAFLDQDIYGLRAGGQLAFNPSWLAYVSAGYESRDYQADDLAFLKKRQDHQYDITLGVNYVPARYWTIKPQISLIKNDSNIDINAFERATMSVNIRREFDW